MTFQPKHVIKISVIPKQKVWRRKAQFFQKSCNQAYFRQMHL